MVRYIGLDITLSVRHIEFFKKKNIRNRHFTIFNNNELQYFAITNKNYNMGTNNRVWTMRYEKGGVRTNMKETGDSDEGQW